MMNNAEQGQMYGRLAVSFTEALQHDGDLGSDRLSLRVEGDRIDAADQAGAAGPLHGGDGPAAEPVSVGIGRENGIFICAHVIFLMLRVALKRGRQLLAGDRIVRAEQVTAAAVYDSFGSGPADSFAVAGFRIHI